jgi:hypothetical protein
MAGSLTGDAVQRRPKTVLGVGPDLMTGCAFLENSSARFDILCRRSNGHDHQSGGRKYPLEHLPIPPSLFRT